VEEVVQVYIKDRKSRYAVRNHSLCGFWRVMVRAGEKLELELEIDKKAMTIVDEEGRRYPVLSLCGNIPAGPEKY